MRTNILKPFLVMFMILAVASTANAYDFNQDGLYYNILSEDDRTVAVFGDKNYSGDVEIPKEILYNSKTYTVTAIGEEAFLLCSGLTSVVIPNSVTSIGTDAFYNCSGLTNVTIPNSVTSIGDHAFEICRGLTSVTIPNSVTSIGKYAFHGCVALTSMAIPNSVTSIGDYTFSYCDELTSVKIPNSVTSIGKSAFYNCFGLTSVTIPSSVTSIGENAFSECLSLKSIYCQWTDPIECNPQFPDNVMNGTSLYVPKGFISAYEKVDPWKNFLNIKEMEYMAGVETMDAGGIEVKVIDGDIVVDGCSEMEVYSMSGQLVYRGAGRAENLAAGVYVVRVADKTLKVMVAR